MNYTKEAQLSKTKHPNPKKMTKIEKSLYEDFIYQVQKGRCFCGCGRCITEYHHATFGVKRGGKDDRYLVGIAQHPCHYAIHHGKDIELKERLILLSIHKSKDNWRDYIG